MGQSNVDEDDGQRDRTEKHEVAGLLDEWRRRTGIHLSVVAARLGLTSSMFTRYYKDLQRPLHKDAQHTTEILRVYSRDPTEDPTQRCTCAEALRFASLTGLPLEFYVEIEKLFPAQEWMQAWTSVFPTRQQESRGQDDNGIVPLLHEIRYLQRNIENYQTSYHVAMRQWRNDLEQLFREVEARGIDPELLPRLPVPTRLFHGVPPRGRIYMTRAAIDSVFQSLDPTSRDYVVTIGGAGGNGKTTLAIQVAHRCREEGLFDQIIWTTAQTHPFPTSAPVISRPFIEFEGLLDDILATLGQGNLVADRRPVAVHAAEHELREQQDVVEQKQRLAYAAMEYERTLLIVDNTDAIMHYAPLVTFFRDLPPSTKVLTTSRVKRQNSPERWIELPPLEKAQAEQLIHASCQVHGISMTTRQVERLASQLGGNPLAILWAINHLYGQQSEQERKPETAQKIDAFLNRLEHIETRPTSDQPERVVLEFCFRQAYDARSEAEQHMLRTLSVFPQPMNLRDLAGIQDLDLDRARTIRDALSGYSLVVQPDESLPDRVALLPLTRRFLLRLTSPQERTHFSVSTLNRHARWYHNAAVSRSRSICVYTPAYKPVYLPQGALVLDFAYHIHTQIGHECGGARIRGAVVPETHELAGGEVIEVLRRAADSTPEEAWKDVVKTRKARQSIEAYFSRLDIATRRSASNAAIHAGNAMCLHGKHNQAQSEYQRAIRLDGYNVRAYTRLGHLQRLRGNAAGVSGARWAYGEALRLEPDNVYALAGLACLDYQQHQVRRAVGRYETVRRLNPGYVNALVGLGRCYCHPHRGEYAKADAVLSDALRLESSLRRRPSVYLFHAIALLGLQRPDAARQQLEASLDAFKQLPRRQHTGKGPNAPGAGLVAARAGAHTVLYYAMALACAGSANWAKILKLIPPGELASLPGLVEEIMADLALLEPGMVQLLVTTVPSDEVGINIDRLRTALSPLANGGMTVGG